jgi:MoaA/NifB/PqqE/SkfB family radical SAM enzyme
MFRWNYCRGRNTIDTQQAVSYTRAMQKQVPIFSLENYSNMFRQIKKYWHSNLDLVGVLDGEYAFTGPELVQIDLTNACNSNCIGCWCRSPLLEDRILPESVQRQTLPLDLVTSVLDECAEMGTTNIYLAGGGEPFMHPHIMDIVRHIKKLGLTCHINTNFTLVDKDGAAKLVETGVDHLIISLWAATPEVYSRTHPNKSEDTFKRLKEIVEHTVKLKKGGPPHIALYNVIMNLNYHEVEAMVAFAAETGVNAVEFAVVDTIPGATDKLLLDDQQLIEILEMGRRIQDRNNSTRPNGHLDIRIGEFLRRISSTGATKGDYEVEMLETIPCLVGWNFMRILADGNVNACLKAHRIPVGNIYENPLTKIWNSAEQRRFRMKAKQGNKNDAFFSMIGNDDFKSVGCQKGCDDIERNRRLWSRLQQQSLLQKTSLHLYGHFLRVKAKYVTKEPKTHCQSPMDL